MNKEQPCRQQRRRQLREKRKMEERQEKPRLIITTGADFGIAASDNIDDLYSLLEDLNG